MLILCDPPFRKACTWLQPTPDMDWKTRNIDVESVPFQGGYSDFIPRRAFESITRQGPPRNSLREDLCYYFTECSRNLPDGVRSPVDATIFAKKIMASQYLLLIEYTDAILSDMESMLQRKEDFREIETTFLEGQWSDIQLVYSRCNRYLKDVSFILLQLGTPMEDPILSDTASWTESGVDFQYIYMRLRTLKDRSQVLNDSLTGLTGIIGNSRALVEAKRSSREAKTVKTLTLVAMIFIPLGFTTGIFSMSDGYLPGKGQFWIFIAVSFPLVIVVFMVTFLFDLGYDTDGVWNFMTFVRNLSSLLPSYDGTRRKCSSFTHLSGSQRAESMT